jgi:hypothetical protein
MACSRHSDEARWRATLRREGAQRLILRPAIVLYVRDPTSSDTGKAAACPRAVQTKRRRTELSASHNGSPGAVGRHNNTANRVAFGCGCPKHPASGGCPHARGARSHSSKGENHGSLFNPAGTLAHASLARRCYRRCRDNDSWL